MIKKSFTYAHKSEKLYLIDLTLNHSSVFNNFFDRVNMEKWNAKIAVVTGASAGIGAEIVRDFAKNGIVVIGLARRVEKVEAIEKELGEIPGKIHAHYCDVSDRRSIEEAFKWIENGFGVVHILINNAGMGTKTKILSDDYNDGDKLDKVINTNFAGLLHVTRAAYSLMNKSDDYGIIVNINSVVGHIVPFPADGESHSSIYPGTKFAVTATTEVYFDIFYLFDLHKLIQTGYAARTRMQQQKEDSSLGKT